MRLGEIRVRDTQLTFQELEHEYPDLMRAVQEGPGILLSKSNQLQELLKAERRRARHDLLQGIRNAMAIAGEESEKW